MRIFLKSLFLGAGLLGTVVAICLAFWGRGDFLQSLISFAIALYGIPICLGIILIAGLWWRWRGSRVASQLTRWTGAIALAAALQALISLPLGHYLASADLAQAQSYCETLVPLLEFYKTERGTYPQAIEQLPDLPPLPRSLADETFYNAIDNSYSFYINDRTALLGEWYFEGKEQQWRYRD